ncbi:Flp pilus assembly protein, protease CpaA [Candidatus Terasakiella magnetica]|nr:Flp pilus assembly protein, protease CpaA [Candidatus Terasakiella magnetica]
MSGQTMAIIASLIFLAALADAALSDLLGFRIPNRAPLLLLAAFVPAVLGGGLDPAPWLDHVLAAGAAFVLCAALYALGVWGGGDAKLVPAVVLWTGWAGLARFLLIMAVVGGILAMLALLARRVPLAPSGAVRAWGERLALRNQVPYGAAIAAGGLDWWLMTVLPPLF